MSRHLGWVIIGWTGRMWTAYDDTIARTRTKAIALWREPLKGDGWDEYDRLRVLGQVRAAKTYFATPESEEFGTDAVALARTFHETYERLALDHGYVTRGDSAKPWHDVPEPNKSLMVDVAREIIRVYTMPKEIHDGAP